MKGYKAFEKGLVCRGKQYAENTVFEEEKAEICNSGMHFCEKPLDVMKYYPLVDANGNMSEFAEVEALDECKTNDNEKYCTKKLRIGSSGYSAQIGSSGYSARIGSSGGSARINSEGKHAVICCAGHNSIAKGKIGSWITLSEWKYSEEGKAHIPICVKTEKIDGERIKEDTYYKLVDGEFVEV